MKKITLVIISCSFAFCLSAQQVQKNTGKSTYTHCVKFWITKPLRDIAIERASTKNNEEGKEPMEQVGHGKLTAPKNGKRLYQTDPVRQNTAGTLALDTPLVNVEGANWYYRPDASIAAGPNDVVQGVNLGNFNIYNKSGALILSTDMSALGISASDDPIVMYDKFADRWVLTDVTNSYGSLTIAVSQTPDPAGAYYVYSFNFPVMPDFPKYSIWTDGYYATYRDINNDTVGVAVFERNRMLKGDPTAGIIIAKFPNTKVVNPESQLPGSPKILTCDGALPPYGTPDYLMYYTNINMGDPSNSIMIYKLVTDTTNKTCKISFVDSLATASYNGYFAGYSFGGNIAEPGGQSVWSLEGPFQYRVPYIRFTGYSSVVLCNTVNLGSDIGGIRWYELRQNDTTGKWSIYQQATYGPSDNISRWNGSISMDLNGDIALAYNVTNSTSLYPGIRYTGRLASDPLGQMTFTEQTVMNGTHSFYTQWGDYSECNLDPDGKTFWGTNQYIIDSTGNTANTRVFSFRLISPSGIANVQNNTATLKVFQSNGYLNVTASGLTNNDKVVVTLFDINGRQINSQWVNPASNGFTTRLNTDNVSKGIYLVRIGNTSFQKVVKVPLE